MDHKDLRILEMAEAGRHLLSAAQKRYRGALMNSLTKELRASIALRHVSQGTPGVMFTLEWCLYPSQREKATSWLKTTDLSVSHPSF